MSLKKRRLKRLSWMKGCSLKRYPFLSKGETPIFQDSSFRKSILAGGIRH
jgi:hypothetical protein